ncbi:hypothetical protein JTB14_016411 [Gonioctena quinquepunctata]|nr:hypothetical protein JTB14_016411 [Gonioctena quinquepunctata]
MKFLCNTREIYPGWAHNVLQQNSYEFLRTGMLDSTDEGHLGIEKCRSRAKETPSVEHSEPSSAPDYPWQIIAVDLSEVRGKNDLVAVDYFSRYMEVAS